MMSGGFRKLTRENHPYDIEESIRYALAALHAGRLRIT
jgi:hypothetical protein